VVFPNNKCVPLTFPENSPKYQAIKHQRDIWHGAKIISKKVTNVSAVL
jgi:hypothetical protein